jgi:hypothetical protein
VNSKLTLVVSVFVIMFLLIGLGSKMKSENVFASEYNPRHEITTNSEDRSLTQLPLESTDEDIIGPIVSQQNECQGSIVICQNILTKITCSDKAVCIIGNLDPFLLVLPY